MALIASAFKTILDINDPVAQGTAPSNPTVGMLWLDISVEPNMLRRWNGTRWVEAGVNQEDVDAIGDVVDDWKAPGKDTIDGGKVEPETVTFNKLKVDTAFANSLFAKQGVIDNLKVSTVGSIEGGTTVTINENLFEIKFKSFEAGESKFTVAIADADDEFETKELMSVSTSGGRFKSLDIRDRIDAPNMAWRYQGETTFTDVEPDTLVKILDALNLCYLDSDITINFKSSTAGTFNGSINLVGIHGPGSITIDGNERVATSGVDVNACTVAVKFKRLFAEYRYNRSPYVSFENVSSSGSVTATGTVSVTAVNAATHRGTTVAASSWRDDTDYNWQGLTDNQGKQRACFWFPSLSSYADATITSATVRLKRVSGIGKGDSVDVDAFVSTRTSATGALTGVVSLGTLGEISNNETATYNIANITALKTMFSSGGCLFFDPEDSDTMSGKVYSSNYAKFYGIGTGYAPVLTFTYVKTDTQVTKSSTFIRDGNPYAEWTYVTPITGTSPANLGNGQLRYRREGRKTAIAGGTFASWSESTGSVVVAVLPVEVSPLYSNVYMFRPCGGSNIARVYINPTGELRIEWVRSVANGTLVTLTNAWFDFNFEYYID